MILNFISEFRDIFCEKKSMSYVPIKTLKISVIFNPLKGEFILNNVQKLSSYLTGNTLRLLYNDQPVNAV
jgi:hypothetical protein